MRKKYRREQACYPQSAFLVLFLAPSRLVGSLPPPRYLASRGKRDNHAAPATLIFPDLTPYGRLFKLLGYTAGGGKYRTTLFPVQT